VSETMRNQLTLIFFLSILVFSFQNCSKVNFEANPDLASLGNPNATGNDEGDGQNNDSGGSGEEAGTDRDPTNTSADNTSEGEDSSDTSGNDNNEADNGDPNDTSNGSDSGTDSSAGGDTTDNNGSNDSSDDSDTDTSSSDSDDTLVPVDPPTDDGSGGGTNDGSGSSTGDGTGDSGSSGSDSGDGSTGSDDGSTGSGGDNTSSSTDPVVYDQIRTIPSFNQSTDILFVLDDSCSMSAIINDVEAGIASVADVNFAPNTKMAVTYMSPVKVDSAYNPEFDNSYYWRSKKTPGHMQLVSKQSIENFLNLSTSDNTVKNAKNRFVHKGCENEWFTPKQTNADGVSCLKAAFQSPNMCTVIEAGITSLDQLLVKNINNNKALFRNKSDLHVIFVSDTHDAGKSGYYGSNNNPLRMSSVTEIKTRILKNNPNLQSIRFSGITKLPAAGDNRLDGITVIGNQPKTSSESYINSEGSNNYSYLKYIKETGGVAIHAKNNKWDAALQKLVDFTRTTSKAIVSLQKPAARIISVSINGTVIDSSKYKLLDDLTTVEVSHEFVNDQSYEIIVRFEAQ
jgi:hypothetical protein